MILKSYALLQKEGWLVFSRIVLSRLKKTFQRLLLAPFALPLAAVITLIAPLIYIRFIQLPSNRVGHYTLDTELLLAVIQFEKNERIRKTFFYTQSGYPVSNAQLHRMWKRTIPILPFPSLIAEVDRYLTIWRKKTYARDAVKRFFSSQAVTDQWDILGTIKKSYLSFTSTELKKGKDQLTQLGVPAGAKYVCLLVRDAVYLSKYMPKNNWAYHDYRDATIENYKEAALFLAEEGYYVLRMGKYVKEAFQVDHPRVIDYATHPLRSDFLDMYLSANCFFFISTSTGIDGAAIIFRRPLLVTNYPPSGFNAYSHERTLFITKKIMDIKNNQLLPFDEAYRALDEAIKTKSVFKSLQKKNLCLLENTSEEITDATKEMLARLRKETVDSVEDKALQERYWQALPKESFAPAPILVIPEFKERGVKFKAATVFLRKNSTLLPQTNHV